MKTSRKRLEILAGALPHLALLFMVLFAFSFTAKADTFHVDAAVAASGDGLTWATAKKTIQEAVDLTSAGDTVLVTNGTYNTGGAIAPDFNNLGTLESYTMTNRVCAYGPITIASVNGPDVTIIEGAPGSNGSNDVDSVRGVYLNNGAVLNGFTVTNGYTIETWSSMDGMGGGIWAGTNSMATNCIIAGCLANSIGGGAYMYFGGTLNNCILDGNRSRGDSGGAHAGTLNDCTISNNSANNSGGVQGSVMNRCVVSGNSSQNSGGGVSGGTLRNCLIIQNSSENGGGVIYATLINCTVSGNTATRYGGGTSNSELYNSISWGNSAGTAGNDCWFGNGFGENSCASDGVTAGVDGCITDNPMFVDVASGNYRLSGTSPCIDAGNNAEAPMPNDLAGNARIVDDTVDMGAYEFKTIAPAVGPTGLQALGQRRPPFFWQTAANATWYHIWVSRIGEGKYAEKWVQAPATNWTFDVDFRGGDYRWWIASWSLDGHGDWSSAIDFSIDAGIPGSLTQIAPTGPQVTHDLTFRWNKDVNATWYRLWVGREGASTWHNKWYNLLGTGEASVNPGGDFPGVSTPVLSAPSGTIADNQPTFEWLGGNCTWWLRPWGPDGYGPWSGATEFSIPYPSGTWFRVYVSQNTTKVIDEWTTEGELLSPEVLSSGTYRWWLGVYDAATGSTIWSDRMDFTVQR